MLVIPAWFNKNHPEVVARGAPADTGTWLIQYMCDRIGITDLGRCDVLDLGCGCRFADAIVNRQLPMKSICRRRCRWGDGGIPLGQSC
jgi:hypothetical protein